MGRKYSDASNGTRFHAVFNCGVAIGKFTGTRAIGDKTDGPARVAFIGERPDVELATFMHETIKRSIDSEWARYRAANKRVGRGAKRSFELGMTSRINQRLRELVAEREAVRNSDCKALVITKTHAVNAAVKHFYPRLSRSSPSGRASNGGAFGAGKSAGDRVGFGRPIGGSASGPAMIGAR
jgi:hypothetical protein